MELYTKKIERVYEPILVCGLGPAGISAAVASALALNTGCNPRNVDVEQLRTLLLENGAILNG